MRDDKIRTQMEKEQKARAEVENQRAQNHKAKPRVINLSEGQSASDATDENEPLKLMLLSVMILCIFLALYWVVTEMKTQTDGVLSQQTEPSHHRFEDEKNVFSNPASDGKKSTAVADVGGLEMVDKQR